ncbi:MAG: cobalamin biosynthesis protein CobD [Oscillospiraceae bacterium]|nr:cobalamin biosynthesis protein CobD [Oscillospiraceae bacterium]
MLILCAAAGGFVLDLIFGDPAWLPHPVVVMGKYISAFERLIRPRLPGTPKGELLGGALLAVSLPLLTLAVTLGACLLARRVHWGLELALQTLWCAQALATRGLAAESRRVYEALRSGDLAAARAAVARIVGRDTARLDAEGVAKAAVETVAENFSDGVAAPMLCMFLGGAPLAMVYKSINTMDSMVGYTSEKYLYFGRFAARLDDLANYIPSRVASLFLIVGAALTGQDAKSARRVWRRDASKHVSPNAGQTEAACAGALGVQLGGDAWYFGERHEKAALGDATRPCVPDDILKANRMMYCASALLCVVCAAARFALVRRL